MKSTRCEEVIVQLVVRTYDDAGRPTGERVLGQPNGAGGVGAVKVFRNAETRDFWGWVDGQIAKLSQAEAAATQPSAPTPAKGKGKR